ncbi:hypothetical protein [uncultured Pseudacidovorax sp.]|uniref:hypothetical protein n=1 Tax=uncultured Pseudacidovorax sp. TaxID=679313 RepID=UPI0025E5FBAD|nr:hypothetical protein [uncultured Pseudacidovorax sp.]
MALALSLLLASRKRRPLTEAEMRQRQQRAEIAAWNAEVDRKKAERKARRLAKRAEAKP